LIFHNVSSAGHAITLAAGSGMTFIGNPVIESGSSVVLRFTITTSSSTAATFDVYVRGGQAGTVTGNINYNTGITLNSATAKINVNKTAITQATSLATGITSNSTGTLITTVNATVAAGAATTFTFTNSTVLASSYVVAMIENYSGTYGTNGQPCVNVNNIVGGACDLVVYNSHGTNALNGALKIAVFVF
jgi:hypothetical protein